MAHDLAVILRDMVLPAIHWRYFLALEHDLAQLARYIEFSHENFDTHSIELLRLLLSANAECDVVLKLICARYKKLPAKPCIRDYQSILSVQFPRFHEITALIPQYDIQLRPWALWHPTRKMESPPWWKACNDVKHHRDKHFRAANLRNVLDALAGLFILTLTEQAIRGDLNRLHEAGNLPILMEVPSSPTGLVTSGYKLPEITEVLSPRIRPISIPD